MFVAEVSKSLEWSSKSLLKASKFLLSPSKSLLKGSMFMAEVSMSLERPSMYLPKVSMFLVRASMLLLSPSMYRAEVSMFLVWLSESLLKASKFLIYLSKCESGFSMSRERTTARLSLVPGNENLPYKPANTEKILTIRDNYDSWQVLKTCQGWNRCCREPLESESLKKNKVPLANL